MVDIRFSDPDVQIVVDLAIEKEPQYAAGDAMWAGSPFQWIKSRPSRQIGKIGEELVADWCVKKGFSVKRSMRIELFLGTELKSSFQHYGLKLKYINFNK